LRDTKRDSDAVIYGRLKYEDEQRFIALGQERDIPVIIPRIFNIAGPYINKYQAYALSSVIDDLLNKKCVHLKAAQPVMRSYLAVSDVIDICLHWLLAECGSAPLVLDAAGEEIIEIGDLARRACRLLGRDENIIDRPHMTTSTENRYVGDGQRFRELAKRYHRPLQCLDEMILSTAEYIRANPA
jgi:UDP-glucuronate decarboxylase